MRKPGGLAEAKPPGIGCISGRDYFAFGDSVTAGLTSIFLSVPVGDATGLPGVPAGVGELVGLVVGAAVAVGAGVAGLLGGVGAGV